MMTALELVERVGIVSDRIDNLLSARKTMPAHIRERCEPEILAELRDELRAAIKEYTGGDPWN